jgi:tetratricopeptide (TPR) repeat protein
VHFFFGTQWTAPLVLVVLAAFAAGLAIGALGMVPRWLAHRPRRAWRATTPTQHPDGSADTPATRMDFDLTWLLWGLPIAFGLGWLASRLDLRQLRIENRLAPKAYFRGLNFLLNEQQDQAIDAFIEAVQNDPDTSELHFALGNLFRRRGEYERAVRVHEHLLSRADLSRADRHRAQHALALDYLKAGLLDRAEEALRKLEGSAYEEQALLALLAIYERSRDWVQAAEIARKLDPAAAAAVRRPPGALPVRAGRQVPRPRKHCSCWSAPSRPRPRRRAPAWSWRPCAAAPATPQAPGPAVPAGQAVPSAVPLLAKPLTEVAPPAAARTRPAPSWKAATSRRLRSTCWTASPPGCRRRGGARLVRAAPEARALAGGRRQVDRRREAGARAVPPRRAARAGPRREAADPLPLRRLRLRGQARISGNAPAARAGTATPPAAWKNSDEPDQATDSPKPACWWSATPCWTATGTAPSNASRPKRRCRW